MLLSRELNVIRLQARRLMPSSSHISEMEVSRCGVATYVRRTCALVRANAVREPLWWLDRSLRASWITLELGKSRENSEARRPDAVVVSNLSTSANARYDLDDRSSLGRGILLAHNRDVGPLDDEVVILRLAGDPWKVSRWWV